MDAEREIGDALALEYTGALVANRSPLNQLASCRPTRPVQGAARRPLSELGRGIAFG